MRECPSCGYGNPDTGPKCGICGRDISSVQAKAAPAPQKSSGLMLFAGLLLLACGALCFFMQDPPSGKAVPAGDGGNVVTDENSFNYEGVLYALDKTTALRFLPDADKRRIPPLLLSHDDRVGCAAAGLIGSWARSETDPALRRSWFETLLGAASSGRPVVRRQAALEAGFAIALGFPVSGYMERVRGISAGLVAQSEPELKAAGFFLSSMSGMEDFSGRMLETLTTDPSPDARLYAACALSRLGHAEGHEYLLKAAAGKELPLRSEAMSCLSYSASPEAERILLSAASDGLDPASAEAAKRGLALRHQLKASSWRKLPSR